MAAPKLEEFLKAEQELAQFAKALSHPARIAILKVLASKTECVCGEIVEVLPLAQSTVSQHLKELKNANIIKGTIEGTAICYCINPETIDKIEKHFGSITKRLQNKCC